MEPPSGCLELGDAGINSAVTVSRDGATAEERAHPAQRQPALHSESVESAAPASAMRRQKPWELWPWVQEALCQQLYESDGATQNACIAASWGAAEAGVRSRGTPIRGAPNPFSADVSTQTAALPTLEQVGEYFEDALGERPVEDSCGTLRFERKNNFIWGTSWRRCLLAGGARGSPGFTLDWWANDDFGLSELREFFEAPFFSRAESCMLYRWLGEGGWHRARLRGGQMRMGVLRRGDVVYVRLLWWGQSATADGG